MDNLGFFPKHKQKNFNFICTKFNDTVKKFREDEHLYNLDRLKSNIIKGILSTEGNLASIEDINLLTTRSFNKLEFSRDLNEKDIQEIWAMDKALYFMQENIDKPISMDIICKYNELVVIGYKSKYSGSLRNTNVYINGSTYQPPDFNQLGRYSENLILEIDSIEGNINKAFSYLLGISKLQLFIDGNKRTALLVALHHLVYSGEPMLLLDSRFTNEYLCNMKLFYETGDNSKILDTLHNQLIIVK